MRGLHWSLRLLLVVLSVCIVGGLASCTYAWGETVPYVEVQPHLIGPGMTLLVSGGDFPPNTPISVRLGPPAMGATPKAYAQATTDSTGQFALSFGMPDRWPDGELIAAQELIVIVLNEDGRIKAADTVAYAPSMSGAETPALTPLGSASHLVLEWRRQVGGAGPYDTLMVYEDGRMVISRCCDGGSVSQRQMSDQELSTMREWTSSYASFSLEQREDSGPDRAPSRVTFVGSGSRQISKLEQQALLAFCHALVYSQ